MRAQAFVGTHAGSRVRKKTRSQKQAQTLTQSGTYGGKARTQTATPVHSEADGQSTAANAGLLLLAPEALGASTATLAKMKELFRSTTGLDLFVSCYDDSAGAWKEAGIGGTVEMPHYCGLIRSIPEGLARCTASHTAMMEEAGRDPHQTCQRCHAGLITVHFPVLDSGKRLADFQTVCVLDQGLNPETFSNLYEKVADLELPRRSLLEAAKRLPVVSGTNVELVSEWLRLFANYLSEISEPALEQQHDSADEEGASSSEGNGVVQGYMRQEIGRHVLLPPAGSKLSCGCSAVLVERVADFLDQYYGHPLSTQLVAYGLGFEPSYFGKMFKHHAKESMAKYLKRMRLNHAKKLLENPFVSIREVAQRAGFSDPSYFTRVFHHSYGLTPTDFRELTKDVR